MGTRLVLVRHGESVHSVESVVGGARGCKGLTENGHEQARRLAERLAPELAGAPVAVYSSVLRRAVETARPIAAALDTTVTEDCRLCTWHSPPYADGMPVVVSRPGTRCPAAACSGLLSVTTRPGPSWSFA